MEITLEMIIQHICVVVIGVLILCVPIYLSEKEEYDSKNKTTKRH